MAEPGGVGGSSTSAMTVAGPQACRVAALAATLATLARTPGAWNFFICTDVARGCGREQRLALHANSPAPEDEILALKLLLQECLQEIARCHPDPRYFLDRSRERLLIAASRVSDDRRRCTQVVADVYGAAEAQLAMRGLNDPPPSIDQISESMRRLAPRTD